MVNDDTVAKRLELAQLLHSLRAGDERPADTILRALRDLSLKRYASVREPLNEISRIAGLIVGDDGKEGETVDGD